MHEGEKRKGTRESDKRCPGRERWNILQRAGKRQQMKETKGQCGYPQFDAGACQCMELKPDIKDKWWFTLAELRSNGLAFITGAGVVCVWAFVRIFTGVCVRERDRGRERVSAGGPQHDWWVWNNRPPSCVFHQTHSSHLTLCVSHSFTPPL